MVLRSFSLSVLFTAFVQSGCKTNATLPAQGTEAGHAASSGIAAAPAASAPNFGVELKDLSVGQHISCGIRSDGTAVVWGMGDFVEAPAAKLKSLSCLDEGLIMFTPDNRVFVGDSDNPVSLVMGQIKTREVKDWVNIPDDNHRMTAGWTLEPDGTVSSIIAADVHHFPSFKSIAGGEWGACGIRTDNTMFCERARAIPGTFTQVAVGGQHICGLDETGAIQCGGSNSHGQSKPPPGKFVQISAGRFHSCALRDDGTIACWGAGVRSGACHEPQWDCGQGVSPPSRWQKVRAGGLHTCAIGEDKRVACWGDNDRGQSSPPTAPLYPESSLRCGLIAGEGKSPLPLICWTQTESGPSGTFTPDVATMAGSQTNLCVVLKDGRTTCMRSGRESPFPPFRVPDVRFKSLIVHEQGACGQTDKDKPICFTVENWAQAPIAPGAKAAYPAPLATLSLMADGHIEVRGHEWVKKHVPLGKYRKLCGGGHWYSNTPDVLTIEQRKVHACALGDDGRIACWGDTPKIPPGVYEDFVCGNNSVCGLTSAGKVECMDRDGRSFSSAEGERLRNLSFDGKQVSGATKDADANGFGVGGVVVDATQLDLGPFPKGVFEATWVGGDIECGKRPTGETICWGRGVNKLRAPAEVKQPTSGSTPPRR